jgi:hypothetical protein
MQSVSFGLENITERVKRYNVEKIVILVLEMRILVGLLTTIHSIFREKFKDEKKSAFIARKVKINMFSLHS